MTQHDDTVRLRHMLDAAREAIELASGHDAEDLHHHRMLELALTRLVEIIGEAAARVAPEMRERHPQLAWAAMIGMRNRLIHGYDNVDHMILWETIQSDLPPLIDQLKQILD